MLLQSSSVFWSKGDLNFSFSKKIQPLTGGPACQIGAAPLFSRTPHPFPCRVGPPNLAAHRSAAGGQPRPRRLRRGQPACNAAVASPLCGRRRCATTPTRAPLGFKPLNREEEDAPSSFLLSRVHCPCSLPPFASLAGAKSYLAISASESSRSLSPPPRASLQPTHHHRPRLRFPKPQISAAAITRGRLAAKLTVGERGPTRSSPLTSPAHGKICTAGCAVRRRVQ